MNPEGQSHHEQTRAKIIRRRSRQIEMRLVRRVRRSKVKKKKKVIRVESEETQDYVRESLNLSQDEAEEIIWCDNRCSKSPQFVAVYFGCGGEGCEVPHGQLASSMLQQKSDGKRRCTLDEVVCSGEEGASWQAMENAMEGPVQKRNVGVFFFGEKAKKILRGRMAT